MKGKVVNVNTNLRIRKGPGTNTDIIGYLNNGDILNVQGKVGDWYNIEVRGIIGYVSAAYVEIINNPPDDSKLKFDKLFNIFKSQLGTPYVYGGAGELITISLIDTLKKRFPAQNYKIDSRYINTGYRAFDCSGFMQWGFKQIGINIGRTTWEQVTKGKLIDKYNARPGDLIFFEKIQHVGMYVGNNKYIESPRPGEFIRIANVSWDNISQIRRIF